jgi:hypothetical protein
MSERSDRSTNAELLRRRQRIQELIIQGRPAHEIVEMGAMQFKTSERVIRDDMRFIAKEWQEKATEDMQLMRNKYNDRLEMLFNLALAAKDTKTALAIQKEISSLNGLYKENDGSDENKVPDFVTIEKRSALKVVGGDSESND